LRSLRPRVPAEAPDCHEGTGRAPPDRGLAATGSGVGLASLRQRIEVVHGTLRAAGTPDGGFCLEATMPSYVPTAEPAV
jgi:signal transduction histidine kinase